jgi:ParB family chromosome partitioning protein
MKSKTVKLSLSEIDFRKTPCLLSFGRSDDDLRASVAAVGVINEPLVRRERAARRYLIVSGFRRLRVCKALGIRTIECRELLAPAHDRDVFLLALFENLGERQFNPIEIGMALARLNAFFAPDEIVKEFLPLFHLEPAYEQYEKYFSLVKLEPQLKRAVASGRMNVSTARHLLRLRRTERAALFALFQQLQLGVNLQKEFLEMLFDVSRRDGTSMCHILASCGLQEILHDEQLSAPHKTERLRQLVRTMRYPRLCAREKEFRRFISRCKLPPAINIHHPPFFEGETFTLNAHFRSAEEFHSIARSLYAISQQGIPASLFD